MVRAGVVALLIVCGAALEGQSIRGTVVDEATRTPIPGVLVTMIGDADSPVGVGVRTDSAGNFVAHAPRAGRWRVRTTRVGYSPVTSPPVELGIGGLAVVRLRLTGIALPLAPVQVVERRQYNADELMSTTGFDLRRERGQGAFLSGQRLEAMGVDGLREIMANHLRPRVFVDIDPVVGEVLRMRESARSCSPEIFLDGRLLASAPDTGTFIDTTTAQTALDSIRLAMRMDAEYSRGMFKQVIALNTLAGLTARDVHGIEVYRANEVPPAGLGAWFGMTKTSVRTCGTVAVWTKVGAQSVVKMVRPNSMPTRPIQVISGTLVDYETGSPVSGREVELLDAGLDRIGRPAVSNERGEFVLRTGRSGELRLRTPGDTMYRVSTSPVITLTPNELVVVRLYVSAKEPLVAPLAMGSRVLPHMVGSSSRVGFTYRRERAQGGVFLRGEDIDRVRQGSILAALRGVPGLVIPADGSARITVRDGRATCTPSVYLDGDLAAPATAFATPLDRLLGVEIYSRPEIIPASFGDATTCAVIAVWTKAS